MADMDELFGSDGDSENDQRGKETADSLNSCSIIDWNHSRGLTSAHSVQDFSSRNIRLKSNWKLHWSSYQKHSYCFFLSSSALNLGNYKISLFKLPCSDAIFLLKPSPTYRNKTMLVLLAGFISQIVKFHFTTWKNTRYLCIFSY